MKDEDLMLSYKSGRVEAFNELYERYSPQVYGYLRKRLSQNEVDDAYQKVWRRLHEKRDLYQDQPFGPWFFVLIKHLVIDEYRSRARRQGHEFQDELIEKIYAAKNEENDIDIDELLAQLPTETASLVRQYYLEGVSYAELEISTGLSQAGLRQRLSRALKGLRHKVIG
jgi:RNA polymerase sigma factor (sigma-70 family)